MKEQIVLLILICAPFSFLSAQDTLITNYPNSQQKWEKIYVDDQKIEERIYHNNGQAWMTAKYSEDRLEQWKWFFENGAPYFEATIIDDQLQGKYKIWYENGQLAEDLIFKNNLENGSAKFYHSNGQLAMQGQYKEGKMEGNWQFFDEDGATTNGPWIWKFAASMEHIRMNGELKKGTRFGQWTYRTTANQNQADQKVFKEIFP